MRHPVQRLYYCARSKFLYAGVAGTIQVFDTTSGSLLRQWEAPEIPAVVGKKQKQQQQKEEAQSISIDERSGGNGNEMAEVEVATGDEEGVAVKKRKKVSFREAPGMGGWSSQQGSNLVTNIVGTSSGRHLVVATNEDKTVRVFRVSELVKGRDMWLEAGGKEGDVEGGLQLLSERFVSKAETS